MMDKNTLRIKVGEVLKLNIIIWQWILPLRLTLSNEKNISPYCLSQNMRFTIGKNSNISNVVLSKETFFKYIFSRQSLQMRRSFIDIFKMPLPVIYFKEERVLQVKVKCRLNHFCETARQSWIALPCWPPICKVPRNAACWWIVNIKRLERDINHLETLCRATV